jgi:preprotein translocase subunit YajC
MNTILLQAPAQSPGGQWQSFIFFGAIILVFYFFMIRPQQKKAKDQKKFIEEVKKGRLRGNNRWCAWSYC